MGLPFSIGRRSQVSFTLYSCCSSEVTDLKYDVPIGQKY